MMEKVLLAMKLIKFSVECELDARERDLLWIVKPNTITT